jgi:hypothetical protein
MDSIATLLAALRADCDADAWHARLEGGQGDLDDLAVTALALGLAPLLQHRLAGWGRPLPAARAQAKLEFARQAERARQAARRQQLAEALARLPGPPVVLKGAYLAEAVYPEPGLRPMNDIDLLFPPGDLPAVAEALRDLGYAAREKSADLGPGIRKHTSTFKQPGAAATPNPYLSGDGSLMIEPHRSLEESWFGLRCDLTPGMLDRAVPLEFAGQPARALAPADALLHLAVHLTFHLVMGSPSFVQLADLAVFTRQVAVDWDDFLARARELRASGYAYAAARLAVLVLAAGFPPEVVRALGAASPPSVRAAAERLSLAAVVQRTQVPPLRSLPQRLRRGLSDRAETARWAHSPVEWTRIWWTLLDVARTDTFHGLVSRHRSST